MKNTVGFWNKRAGSYDKAVFDKYRSIYEVIITLSKKHLKTDDVMLDFACGTGSLTNELAGS